MPKVLFAYRKNKSVFTFRVFFALFSKKALTNGREPCIMHTYSKGFDEEDAKRTNKEK